MTTHTTERWAEVGQLAGIGTLYLIELDLLNVDNYRVRVAGMGIARVERDGLTFVEAIDHARDLAAAECAAENGEPIPVPEIALIAATALRLEGHRYRMLGLTGPAADTSEATTLLARAAMLGAVAVWLEMVQPKADERAGILDIAAEFDTWAARVDESYSDDAGRLALYRFTSARLGTLAELARRAGLCPGSGMPAVDPMPENVDRWGTCPVCGGTSSANDTSGARMRMVDHEPTSSAVRVVCHRGQSVGMVTLNADGLVDATGERGTRRFSTLDNARVWLTNGLDRELFTRTQEMKAAHR